MHNGLHVVLGAGQIGPRVAQLLLREGHKVRIVRQNEAGPVQPNLEWARGDIRDLKFAEEATRGATRVYDCIVPPYHRWSELLLPVARGVLHGAQKASAKLVALDNLYMYGKPNGLIREDSPIAPCSKKGRLRAELAEVRLAAHQKGDVSVAIARAADFFGADLPQSNFGERFYQRILAGKPAECNGDPDMPHSYTYVEDVARAMVTLGNDDRSFGQVWLVPTNPAESTRQLVRRIGWALGVEADATRIPKLLMRGLGLFWPLMRELFEMRYQWETRFEVDDARFRNTFGWSATPIAEQVAATAAWARKQFSVTASPVYAT